MHAEHSEAVQTDGEQPIPPRRLCSFRTRLEQHQVSILHKVQLGLTADSSSSPPANLRPPTATADTPQTLINAPTATADTPQPLINAPTATADTPQLPQQQLHPPTIMQPQLSQ